ncbi:hypothetical protein Tco_1495063, partial [Tanacetum coccineum]
TIPLNQASSLAPPLSTSIIDLTPPKLVSPPVQEPIFIATTATTTTVPLPPPPPQQRTTVFELATVHDLYSKIDKYVNEVVKEAVHNALQALIRERFRELSEFEMKEIFHDRMFKSGSYISHPEHTTLYEALEAPMDHENREEFNEEMAKSRKRCRDDQDHLPPPPKDSDRSKKKRHDSDASALKKPLVQKSSVWKTSDTKEAPSSSSKQKFASLSKQPIKTRPDWLKLVPEEETLKTPEPDWVIPPNDLPDTENNWADAIAKTYKDPEENKLLQKTRDMGSFIKWYCKQIGKKKLVKADFEGQAYKIVQPFHKNSISLQFQMEECHLLLTDKIDLINPEGNQVVHDMSKPLPRHALSISKLKAAYYLDFGLEELVPSLWTESESDYDISSAYGISHWWFKRKEFYITRHNAPSDRNAVRSHIKILSVVSLMTYFIYSKLNHLSRADKVYLSTTVNLWTRNIVIRQHVEDLQLGIESYQMKLNITQPRWDATDFLFKEFYTIVHKLRAVIYRDRNNQKKMMREIKVHNLAMAL